jgi:peroxiredoxin
LLLRIRGRLLMKSTLRTAFTLAGLSLAVSSGLLAQRSENWSGFATVQGHEVPVHLRLSTSTQDGPVTGGFVNERQFSPTSSGTLSGEHLILTFDYFARKLDGNLQQGTFTGTYGGQRGQPVPVKLHEDGPQKKALPGSAEKETTSIRGDWEIAVKSPKGEDAWTLRISPLPHGKIKAIILRIDGDTNALYGTYDEAAAEFQVSHFSAAGPALYTLKPQADGTLLVTNPLKDGQQWTARRPAEARKKNLTPPTKSTDQTSVADSTHPFSFSAPDLEGNVVSNTDAQFRGKVVIVAIGGSWCPNCHDEAPFLVELYKRYHSRGLEIVNISFEEEDQLKDPQRLRAFIAKYRIPYTVLLGGTTEQVHDKLPQAKNLDCWPTTFFINRKGLVQEVHAGFAGPETGASYTQLKAETDAVVGKLLAQHDVASR